VPVLPMTVERAVTAVKITATLTAPGIDGIRFGAFGDTWAEVENQEVAVAWTRRVTDDR